MASSSGAGGVRGPVLDVLFNAHINRKARPLLEALQRGGAWAGFDARLVDHSQVRPKSWLLVYGLGGHDRVHYVTRGRLVAFDLAYWDRKLADRKYRVSVNGFHCPERVLRGDSPGPERWAQSGLTIAVEQADRAPILLVGNGPKSAAIGAEGWAARKSVELRAQFPGRPIWYRPKPGRTCELGVDHDLVRTEEPVDSVLADVGLVVCRHSNVAVDACRLGVPVVCDDGAAACIYPSSLAGWQAQPTYVQRVDFLHRLAWWQWTPAECETAVFWDWLKGQMG